MYAFQVVIHVHTPRMPKATVYREIFAELNFRGWPKFSITTIILASDFLGQVPSQHNQDHDCTCEWVKEELLLKPNICFQ